MSGRSVQCACRDCREASVATCHHDVLLGDLCAPCGEADCDASGERPCERDYDVPDLLQESA